VRKLYARLLVFFVGLPAIACLIILLPGFNHLAFNTAVWVICAVGTGEMIKLFERESVLVERWFLVPLSMLAPLGAYLGMVGGVSEEGLIAFMATPFVAVIIRHTVAYGDKPFKDALRLISASFTALLYPGFFALFFIKIASLSHPTLAFLVFLSMVFANDTSAYVFGMLFGKNSRGVSNISPNKSVPGFIAGPVFSVGVALLYYAFTPAVFGNSAVLALVAGVCVGAATVIGDLFESLLKRSAGVKDSGILIPGRGGVLDSVDSVFFAAPVYYLLLAAFA